MISAFNFTADALVTRAFSHLPCQLFSTLLNSVGLSWANSSS
jgi:hypothetical protein